MIKPYNPEETKYFKTPKYTGFTLSLLSLFVLASMLVVWQKTSTSIIHEDKILVLADSSSKEPITHAVNEFIREMNLPVKVSFHSKKELNSIFIKSLTSDLYLIMEDDLNSTKRSSLFLERIPVAHKTLNQFLEKKSGIINSKNTALLACIPFHSKNSSNSLLFARYLAAPSRGQFQFAKSGWTGVDGDTWEENPKIKIFCGLTIKDRIDQKVRQFESREGVSVEIESFQKNDLVKTIQLIAKSNAKNYMPDLIILEKENFDTKEVPFKKESSTSLIHLETRFELICQRLISHLKTS